MDNYIGLSNNQLALIIAEKISGSNIALVIANAEILLDFLNRQPLTPARAKTKQDENT